MRVGQGGCPQREAELLQMPGSKSTDVCVMSKPCYVKIRVIRAPQCAQTWGPPSFVHQHFCISCGLTFCRSTGSISCLHIL